MHVTLGPPAHSRGRTVAHSPVRWARPLIVGALTIAAVIVPVSSARAATTPGIMFAGPTAQRWPAFFAVSPNGRSLVFANAALWMKCTSGAQFVVDAGFARVPIRASGKFQASYSHPLTLQSDGSKVGMSETISGTLNHRHTTLSGVWEFMVTAVSPSGHTDRCDSGAVRFHAIQ